MITHGPICYPYHDAAGALACTLERRGHGLAKKFRWRAPRGSPLAEDEVPALLYRLPDLLASSPSRTVYLVEGEKDVEALRSVGLVATTNPGGTHRGWRASYTPYFRGRHCVILADQDRPGRRHARVIEEALTPVAASLCTILPFGERTKGNADITDWLDRRPSSSDLRALVESMVRREQIQRYQGMANAGIREVPIKAGQVAMIFGARDLSSLQKLLLLAMREMQGWSSGDPPVKIPDLARWCSVSREAAQRNISRLRSRGWLVGFAVQWGRLACAKPAPKAPPRATARGGPLSSDP